MSYVYLKSPHERLYTVGFYDPEGDWHPESDHGTEKEAAARVVYLNSGSRPAAPDAKPTLRDYFAAAALTGLCATFPGQTADVADQSICVAEDAYKLADAMIEAREK